MAASEERKIETLSEGRQASLAERLRERRDAVIARWFDAVARTYPAQTAGFLKRENDRFGNPVGAAIMDGLRGVLDELTAGDDTEKIKQALDKIVRIRSVQDFSASEAVAFVFQLKAIVREELSGENPEELAELDRRIDGLALLAFDCYAGCREDLHRVRTGEIQRRAQLLVERAIGKEANSCSSCGMSGECGGES